MNRKSNPLSVTVALALWCGLNCFLAHSGWAQAASGASKPRIKFDQTTYDFGKTSQVETVTGTFSFRNTGDAPLVMGKPTTSCGCTVAGVKPSTLKPGEKGELTFSLNLGRTRAVLNRQITVESNDPENPKVVLTIKADYTPLYEMSPSSIYLALREGDTTNLTARVTRTDGKPIKLAKITSGQPWVHASVRPNTEGSNASVQLDIKVQAEGKSRYFSDQLVALIEGSDQPAFTLPISGRITGDLVLTPESLYWPISDPDKAIKARRILLKSSRPEKLEIKNLSSSLPQITVETVWNEDGKNVELIAKLASVPDRSLNGTIRFETNVPGQPEVQIPVTSNVTGKPASGT
jgi:hypothetical protein